MINQGTIIMLGVILWLVTLAISIVFVMRYAKKVKANKGSTILSLQEQENMKAEFGEAQQEAENAEANPSEKLMTGRQKWTLVVFALTFVVMIVGFIPWGDFGVEAFDAGAVTEEVTTQVSGAEDVAAVYTDKDLGVFEGDVSGTVTTEEQVSEGWSAFLTGLPLGQWYFDEASTWFLIMAIIIGIVGGISESRFVKAFIDGTADMMSVVLIIAMARSITVLMGETGLDMWILNNAAAALNGLSAIIFAPLSFLLYIVLSFAHPVVVRYGYGVHAYHGPGWRTRWASRPTS